MWRSLRTQISLTIILIVLFTVAIISFFSNEIMQRNFEDYVMEQQNVKVDDIVANIESRYNQMTQTWDSDFIHGVGMYALSDGFILKVYDNKNNVIWDAENHDTTMCNQIMADISERMEKSHPDMNGSFESSEYILRQRGRKIGTLSVSSYGPYFYNDNDFQFLYSMNIALFAIGAFCLILSLAAGTLLARWIARPIARTALISKEISAGNYSIRFESKTKTKELNELAGAVNHLAKGLEVQENLRKHIIEDVGHELRTPLTTVASHLEMMLEGVWEPTHDRLKSCYEEIGRLSGLVADIEQLAVVEGDNLNLDIEPVDLLDITNSVVANFEAELKKKNITVKMNQKSAVVLADKDRINQVITNLTSNAIKYSPDGGNISMVLKYENSFGALIVEDTGVGIPKEQLPFIFERFYRADKSRNRKTGGAGIGLAIVKSIMDAHGGTVSAESQLGEGSRFIIKLPKA